MNVLFKFAVVTFISTSLVFPITIFAQDNSNNKEINSYVDDGYTINKNTYTVTSVNISTSEIYGGCKITMSAENYTKEEVTVKQNSLVQAGDSSLQDDNVDVDINDCIYYTTDGSDPYYGEHYENDGFELKTAGTYRIKAVANYMSGAKHEISTEVITIKKAPRPYIDIELNSNYAEVEISNGYDDAIIYYTTDGSDPTEDSQQYSNSFDISETGEYTVKAIAVANGLAASDIVEKTVCIDDNNSNDDPDDSNDPDYDDSNYDDSNYDNSNYDNSNYDNSEYDESEYDESEYDSEIIEENKDNLNENTNNELNCVTVTIGKEEMYINDERYDMEAAPYIQNSSNSTLVPLRFVALAISNGDIDSLSTNNSCKIYWDANEKTATIIYQVNSVQRIVQFTAGSSKMLIDGTAINMTNGAMAEISNGRMYVPFRSLGIALGVTVKWDEETRSAIYYYSGQF